jgi:hypothetical protein
MSVYAIGYDLWKAMPDGPEKYQAYLCSRHWAEKRNAVFKRCGCICERCGVNAADHVHHLTYARKYDEQPGDLQALCRGCHDFTHGKSNCDPKPIPVARTVFAASDVVDDFGFCAVDRGIMLCPVCQHDCSHIRSAFTVIRSDEGEACVYPGTEAEEASEWRRSGIAIVFDGECGHSWRMVIQQHKGANYVWCETGKDTNPYELCDD